MTRRCECTFFWRGNTDGEKAHEEMLNTTSHREMQIKATVRRRLPLVSWPLSKGRVLAGMWSKGNTYTLLVGIEIGAAIKENSIEVSQKIKNRTTKWPGNSTSGYLSKENENTQRKHMFIPVFVAALFISTIAKMWKWWRKKMWYKDVQWNTTQP